MEFFKETSECSFKKQFTAAAEPHELAQVFLVPRAGCGIFPLLRLCKKGFLVGRIVRRKERGRPISLMDGNFAQAELGENTWQQIADAVIASAGGDASAMPAQPKLELLHQSFDWLVLGQ